VNVPVFDVPERRWECPSCDLQQVTRRRDVHTQFHHCRGLAGLWAPMVAAGTRAKAEVNEREDYIGSEQVQLHQGRPVMNLVVTRDDGQDCVIFAPAAGGAGSME
jgi:hypothetical protein